MLTDAVAVCQFDTYGFTCKGLFASRDLDEGELIWEDAGQDLEPLKTYSRAEIMASPHRDNLITYSYMRDDDLYASSISPEVDNDASWYFNHSCDPTCWYVGDSRIVTKRRIVKGEQLVYDYACTETESSLHYGMKCLCRAATCRGLLTFSQYRSRKFMKDNAGHVNTLIARKHAEVSWFDPRVELRHVGDNGHKTLIAREAVAKGNVVVVFAGKILSREAFLEEGANSQRDFQMSLQVGRDLWQVPIVNGVCETGDHVNHSCDPSCGMADSVTLVTLRDLEPGAEVTLDYATVNDGSIKETSDNFECHCGSKTCRKMVTSADWRLPELQSRLKQWFSPFLREMINNGEI